ncbi:AAA family ATPase [Corynebacterium sp. YIM 101645]|uniref:AAA family ATPase n=1 Tax=Corynebacterium lemuris TaxID=1859292 RepID=A0ABT2FXC0_9CORY|nr:AAA family ATPase [Corynebacterium lemuris]MCS5479133.1 AAA family ATPase [Corynebacterium lemuris]
MSEISITPEFAEALSQIRSGMNVLITGKAGTGKSTLLRTYLETADEVGTSTLVTAPTGVAALNIDGFTIHRTFGFRPGMYPDDLGEGGKWSPSNRVTEVLRKVEVLVVDEISMVRADLFDMMDKALRLIRRSEEPFGGVQLILVGDLLQLPPVLPDNERELFNERWETPYFFSAHCFPDVRLTEVHLTTVWRQTDPEFVDILNDVREGSVTKETLDRLNENVDPEFNAPDGWVTLTAFRRNVERINARKLAELPTEKFVSHAVKEGETSGFTFSGTEELHYAVGARVMTVINDPVDRFVNGSFATIIDASAETISVRLDHSGEVVTLRPHVWQIQRPTVTAGRLASEDIGSITQLPVILAWALTIHKSQGKTIPRLFIDLKGGTATDGQFYVALSRAVDLERLRFSTPVEQRHIRANNALVRKVRREVSNELDTSRQVFLSFDGVNFGVSEHIARIHVIIFEGDRKVADFGSWINPMADLGAFGQTHRVPAGGLAMAPTLGDFWPLLLRQAAGGVVIGDRLAMLERAVRHQEKGMNIGLGVGYDIMEFDLTPTGDDVATRCGNMVEQFRSGGFRPRRGQVVPVPDRDREGAVLLPSWAPESPMVLDPRQATDSDAAWAAMSGGAREDLDADEVRECAELMSSWAISRGFWTAVMHQELLDQVVALGVIPGDLPAPLDMARDLTRLLAPGTRVAFTGRNYLLGGPADDERLTQLCADRDLEYKTGVSKSRCDVLVAGDVGSMSRKAQNAREYGKPIISQEDFETWYEAAPAPVVSGSPAAPVVPASVELQVEPMAPSPAPVETAVALLGTDTHELLQEGTRVAFRGSLFLNNERYAHGEPMASLCDNLGLEYKQAVTKTRCDVLVTDDPGARDGKSALARRFGTPMIATTDFAAWAEQRLAELDQDVTEVESGEVEEAADEIPVDAGVASTTVDDVVPEVAPLNPVPEEIPNTPPPAVPVFDTEPEAPWDREFSAPQTPYVEPAMAASPPPHLPPPFAPQPFAVPHEVLGLREKRQMEAERAGSRFRRSLAVFGALSLAFVVTAFAGAPVAVSGIILLLWMVCALVVSIQGLVALGRNLRR